MPPEIPPIRNPLAKIAPAQSSSEVANSGYHPQVTESSSGADTQTESSPSDFNVAEVESSEAIDHAEKAFSSILELSEVICDTKSPEANRYFLERLSQILSQAANTPDTKISPEALESLNNEMEQIPDLEEIQQGALRVLENMGAIYYSPDPEHAIIARLDKISTLDYSEFRAKVQKLFESEFYGKGRKAYSLYYAFKDLRVISEEDYAAGVREGKEMFYSPKTAEEAFDVESIKKADFYLGLWETMKHTYSDQAYPSTEDQANFAEVALACMIYHPNYGNGFRDETGKLMVADDAKNNYRQVSGEKLLRGAIGLKAGASRRPAEFVAKELPNLNRNGLLTPEDFGQKPSLGAERPYFTKRQVALAGNVMIDGIQYFFGKQKAFQGAEVYKVSDSLAIMCKDGEITHTFSLRSPDDPELVAQSNNKRNTSYKRALKETTGLSPFDAESFSQRRPEESMDDYQKRVASLEDFDIWLRLDSLLGDEGLGTYRQMEFEPEFAKLILSLQSKLSSEDISEIVNLYRTITKSTRDVGNFLRNETGIKSHDGQIIQRVVRNLMRKGLKLLIGYAENPPSLEQIKTEMSNLQSEVAIFAATFKESRNEQSPSKLEDFKNFQVDAVPGSQINQNLQDQMTMILIQNRMDRPDIIEQAKKEFMTALANPDTTFYLLKFNDELVGFFRLDRLGELDAHLGSLNVPPHIQGSGIGDETLRSYFTAALNGRIGHASADPRNPITPQYIGRYNFVGTSVKSFGDSGRPFVEMRLDPELNSHLEFFQADDEKIASLYTGNEYQLGQDYIILRFPESDLDGMMSESANILSNNRYVMSAFRKIKNEHDSIDIYTVYEIKPGQENAFLHTDE